MLRKREIIVGLDWADAVAVEARAAEVFGEGLGVAGDVQDVFDAVLEDLFKGFGRDAAARRVDDYHIRLYRNS